MKTHPNLSSRIAQNSTSPAVTEKDLRMWFAKIKSYLETKCLPNIDACRKFNTDESSFILTPKDNIVLFARDARSVYRIFGYDEKATITTLFNASAAGQLVPSLVWKKTPKSKALKIIDRT